MRWKDAKMLGMEGQSEKLPDAGLTVDLRGQRPLLSSNDFWVPKVQHLFIRALHGPQQLPPAIKHTA